MKLDQYYAELSGINLSAQTWADFLVDYITKEGPDPRKLLSSISNTLPQKAPALPAMCALNIALKAFDALHASDLPYFALVKNIFADQALNKVKGFNVENQKVLFYKAIKVVDKRIRDSKSLSLLSRIEASEDNIAAFAWFFGNPESLVYDAFNDKDAVRLERLFVYINQIDIRRSRELTKLSRQLLYHHPLSHNMVELRRIITGTEEILDQEVFYRCLASYKFERSVQVPLLVKPFLEKYSVILASEILKLSPFYSLRKHESVERVREITSKLVDSGIDFQAALLLDDDHVDNIAMFTNECRVERPKLIVLKEIMDKISYNLISGYSIHMIVATELLKRCSVEDLNALLESDSNKEHYFNFSGDTRILGIFTNKQSIKKIATADFGL